MSSLFDDLSLPDAFRRLDGVRVTPSTPPSRVAADDDARAELEKFISGE